MNTYVVRLKVGRHFSGIPPPSFIHGERGGLRGVAVSSSSRGIGGGGRGMLSGVGGGGGSGNVSTNGGGSGSGAVGGGVDGASMTDRELFSTGSVSCCCCR